MIFAAYALGSRFSFVKDQPRGNEESLIGQNIHFTAMNSNSIARNAGRMNLQRQFPAAHEDIYILFGITYRCPEADWMDYGLFLQESEMFFVTTLRYTVKKLGTFKRLKVHHPLSYDCELMVREIETSPTSDR
jgi:hypothetical protein